MSHAAHVSVCAAALAMAMGWAIFKDSAVTVALFNSFNADVRAAQQFARSAIDGSILENGIPGYSQCIACTPHEPQPTSMNSCETVAAEWTILYMWAWASVLAGVWLMAVDGHFRLAVCVSLSANYWCAVASLAYMVSPAIAVALGLTATVKRRSMLLFPDSRTPSASRVNSLNP